MFKIKDQPDFGPISRLPSPEGSTFLRRAAASAFFAAATAGAVAYAGSERSSEVAYLDAGEMIYVVRSGATLIGAYDAIGPSLGSPVLRREVERVVHDAMADNPTYGLVFQEARGDAEDRAFMLIMRGEPDVPEEIDRRASAFLQIRAELPSVVAKVSEEISAAGLAPKVSDIVAGSVFLTAAGIDSPMNVDDIRSAMPENGIPEAVPALDRAFSSCAEFFRRNAWVLDISEGMSLAGLPDHDAALEKEEGPEGPSF